MVRVLHISPGRLFGGIETMLVTIAEAQRERAGWQHEFAICFEGRLMEELRATGAAVHHLGECRMARPWSIPLARRRFVRLQQPRPPEVMVFHGCWPHAFFASSRDRQRTTAVFYAHGFANPALFIDRIARWTPTDLVLANSQCTLKTYEGFFAPCPSAVLHVPVRKPKEEDRSAVRAAVRAELGTASDAVVVMMACRMESWKGHQQLLKALGRTRTDRSWECWIVGGAQLPAEEAYANSLRDLAQELGIEASVRFVGQRRDVPRLLHAADLLCQPNESAEPFGITFIEAMYQELPILTTAMGGPLEIVDASCGILVPPGDMDALAAGLEELIANESRRRQLGLAARHRAETLSDPNHALERFEELVSPLLPDRRRAA